MGKTRKKQGRRYERRQRQLKNQKSRIERRDTGKYVPAPMGLARLIRQRGIELGFIGMMFFGIWAVFAINSDRGGVRAIEEEVSQMVVDQSWAWEEQYPQGYKVIALKGREIIPTAYDTLPAALRIDWEKMAVSLIQDNKLGESIEKIKFKIEEIEYDPAGISGLTIVATLLRREGAASQLGRFADKEFIVSIVRDTGEYIFCLFALR